MLIRSSCCTWQLKCYLFHLSPDKLIVLCFFERFKAVGFEVFYLVRDYYNMMYTLCISCVVIWCGLHVGFMYVIVKVPIGNWKQSSVKFILDGRFLERFIYFSSVRFFFYRKTNMNVTNLIYFNNNMYFFCWTNVHSLRSFELICEIFHQGNLSGLLLLSLLVCEIYNFEWKKCKYHTIKHSIP